MYIFAASIFIISLFVAPLLAQSGRTKNYSESFPQSQVINAEENKQDVRTKADDDEIIINTELVVVPVQITDKKGKSIVDIKRGEFKIFENGIEQEIEYFSNQEQPFTVALILDMSYSSIFKLDEIQNAAKVFTEQLRPNDKVMIVSFDKDVRILCEPTNNKKVMRLAIEATKIASGTSLYMALDLVLNQKFNQISGRKAVVLLSDGVDTSSRNVEASDIINSVLTGDAVFYSIRYDTYDDVQKNRKKDAQIFYDENNRPYIVERPYQKGEKESDYKNAAEFLKTIGKESGGKVYTVNSNTNLSQSFANIANELRRIYSIGYYPKNTSSKSVTKNINVRVYRPDLNIRTKRFYKTQ